MKKKSKVLGLTKSMLALVLCVVMLIGTTLAWFTVEVTNNGNRIEAGKMELNLLKYDDIEKEYRNIGENKLFDGVWEPGHTKIAFLAVENAGTLAFNYEIVLNITEGDKPLSAVLDYAILSPADKATFDAAALDDWNALIALDGVETGDMPLGEVLAAPKGALEAGETDYFALAIYMDKNAGDEYQGGWINIDLEINAKQMPAEGDYFGDQYDAPENQLPPPEWESILSVDVFDFENGTADPLFIFKETPAATVEQVDGDYALKLAAGSRQRYYDETTYLYDGETYKITGWFKTDATADVSITYWDNIGSKVVNLFGTWPNGATDPVIKETAADGWNYFEIPVPTGYCNVVSFVLNNNSSSEVYFDDVQFVKYIGDANS